MVKEDKCLIRINTLLWSLFILNLSPALTWEFLFALSVNIFYVDLKLYSYKDLML